MSSKLRRHAFHILVLGVSTAVAAGGCSSGSNKATPSTTSKVTPVILHATTNLEGAIVGRQVQDIAFSSLGTDTCAAFARSKSTGSSGVLVLPMPTRFGTRHLSWTASIIPYNGPGTYSLSAIPKFKVGLVKGKTTISRTFKATSDTEATAVLRKNGSGTFKFRNLHDGSEVLSGKTEWTCGAGS